MNIVKKHSLFFLGLLLIFVMFNIFVSLGAAVASGSSYKINLAQYETGSKFPGYRAAEYFKQRVDELSDGRITVNHFPGDLLGDWQTQQIHVKEGSLDMCLLCPSSAFDPETEFIRLPYVIFSWEGARNVYGPGCGGEKLLKEICQKNNTYCLATQPGGFIVVLSKKEFTPLPGDKSIKKLKTRVMPAKIEQISGETLGFLTLSMPWGEISSSLMLGTIDAVMGSAYYETGLFKDMVKYQYNYNYGYSAQGWIINGDLWKSLPAEDQEILQTAMGEAVDIEWGKAIETQEASIVEMKEAGVQVIDLTKEQMKANVSALRDKVWSWAAENMYSEEFVNKIKSFVEPIPIDQ